MWTSRSHWEDGDEEGVLLNEEGSFLGNCEGWSEGKDEGVTDNDGIFDGAEEGPIDNEGMSDSADADKAYMQSYIEQFQRIELDWRSCAAKCTSELLMSPTI